MARLSCQGNDSQNVTTGDLLALLACGCCARGLSEDSHDPPHGTLHLCPHSPVGVAVSASPASGGLLSRLRGPNGRIPTRTRWLLAACIVLVVVVTSVLGLFWPLISLMGLAALIAGVVAMVRGSVPVARLRSRRAGALAIVVGLFVLTVGSAGSAVGQPAPPSLTSTPTASPTASASASPKPTRKATATPTPTPTPTPVASSAEVQEATPIPYAAVSVDDNTIDVGVSAITVAGANGEKVTTYLVQYVDGVEVSRAVAREEITVAAVDEVTAIGSRVPEPAPVPEAPAQSAFYQNCDAVRAAGAAPLYASDPGYSRKLDRDGDGVACET